MAVQEHSRVDDVVDELLEKVVSGEFVVDQALPPESEISTTMGVSRLTTREAIKTLRAQNIVYVRRGVGTYVNAPSKWTNLAVVLRSVSHGMDKNDVALKLLEARQIVETGAAALAATRRDERDLESMRAIIVQMEQAGLSGDVRAFTAADLAFHDAVLAASGNAFVPAMLAGLSSLLFAARVETSAFPEIQQHALQHHDRVLDAIASGDSARAHDAMQQHIDQTYADYEKYLSVG
jgi:GntR family transcriptional regulator, transcriptional repressor for pyruvate dehydrogenase complex